jgi:mannosyl-3-phosphoglycerate phosphatase
LGHDGGLPVASLPECGRLKYSLRGIVFKLRPRYTGVGVKSYVIFTDLDGTLLDHDSYSYEPAKPALLALRAKRIPLIFCTSKTRAEVEALRDELGNDYPFIVENGAAILIPTGYFPFSLVTATCCDRYDVILLGVPYTEVVAVLKRAATTSGCAVRGFHDMSVAEVALGCGLSVRDAENAKTREYDEPFEVLTDSPALIGSLLNRIEEQGLTWTRGGRFYHARGRHNKGDAARFLAGLYRRSNPDATTVGLGDGPNDLSLLETVDVPIPCCGPRAWNDAILRLLQ